MGFIMLELSTRVDVEGVVILNTVEIGTRMMRMQRILHGFFLLRVWIFFLICKKNPCKIRCIRVPISIEFDKI